MTAKPEMYSGINDRKICTFTFRNGTTLRAAVPFLFKTGVPEGGRTFQQMFEAAKEACWRGDEENGRGPLISFEVGDHVTSA